MMSRSQLFPTAPTPSLLALGFLLLVLQPASALITKTTFADPLCTGKPIEEKQYLVDKCTEDGILFTCQPDNLCYRVRTVSNQNGNCSGSLLSVDSMMVCDLCYGWASGGASWSVNGCHMKQPAQVLCMNSHCTYCYDTNPIPLGCDDSSPSKHSDFFDLVNCTVVAQQTYSSSYDCHSRDQRLQWNYIAADYCVNGTIWKC
jgi:hypothetical protein